MTANNLNTVLIIGSAPDAIRAEIWPKTDFSTIIAINNAWRIRDDWDYNIYPEDFPVANQPSQLKQWQQVITASDYVTAQNYFGGFVYAGGTMSFTAGYWALSALKPDVLLFIGCDMVYTNSGAQTHFYGFGSADPLRNDVTLQSLEAKSARLFQIALQNNCLCLNLSDQLHSRLTFPIIDKDALSNLSKASFSNMINEHHQSCNTSLVRDVLNKEQDLGYYIESGRYWEHLDKISSEHLREIDTAWLATLANP